jgi:DNA-directed RNA polymerase sigma subunit (sigma70/sigma32)
LLDARINFTHHDSAVAIRDSDGLILQKKERDQQIVARRAAGETLEAIGNDFGISGERVRQIESRAALKAARNARVRAKFANLF